VTDELRAARSVADLVYWDDRVVRPQAAAEWHAARRQEQALVVHDLLCSERMERAITTVEAEHADNLEARAMRRERDRVMGVPRELFAQREAIASAARVAWDEARIASDFSIFEPRLAELVETTRDIAEAVGYDDEPYEVCLAEWEPGIELATVDRLFRELEQSVRPLLDRRHDEPVTLGRLPLSDAVLIEFERRVLELVGFDLQAGIVEPLDRAFCIGVGPFDVRMTSRFRRSPGIRGIHSTIHEAGHGIYAQSFGRLGVPSTLAMAPSFGADEAQSRMFENMICRAPAFSAWALRQLQELAPDIFTSDVSAEALHREFSTAESPLRRLGADQLSYDLHIMLRTRLERALVNGDLAAADLPDAWNDGIEELLGVRPADDAEGCLQDVHWSLGQWGYFPTYTLGNIFATQLLETARGQIGDIDAALEAGSTEQLRAWLDANVNIHGRAYTGVELVERVSDRPLSVAPLVAHLERTFPA
jgi:carboxypeptidase Taq